MFCPSCGKKLFGGETFCPYCGMKLEQASQEKEMSAPAVAQSIQTEAQTAPVKAKPGLHGFAKGWVIFVIVAYSAAIASNLTYMTDPYKAGILLMPLLCIAAMIVGAAMVLKAKHYGLWIMVAFSIMLMLLNGSSSGNYTLITVGGLIYLFLTWLFTRKQVHYFGKKKKLD